MWSPEQLEHVLYGVPISDFLVLVCDFKAQVGVFSPEDNLWHGVAGKYGIEESHNIKIGSDGI